MRLLDLDPEFIQWAQHDDTPIREPAMDIHGHEKYTAWQAAGSPYIWSTRKGEFIKTVATLAEAQGIAFDCPAPACQAKGPHRIHVAFRDRGVLDHQGSRSHDGTPSRWQVVSGSGVEDLTLSPSIDCTHNDPQCWHGLITDGTIT